MLAFGVIAFSINGYATNIAQDVAIESAHYAALADVDLVDARAQASRNLEIALGGVFESTVSVDKTQTQNGCRTVATVTLSTLVLGLLGSSVSIKEVASAICELQE